ncbi:uncharacterized protein LOC125243250 [Megalobrama amblycephala]|uniref:uncharacterized protein LOC125243250 n=1 Tax=Megalobrama amblycephala TaxID=75352 RepID=UPI0020145281|nr:uncharacterized protein LOC125243250 [Megalobrama amblycephala]XP_048008701.1 uncharacterized protein LOC125243250 [Megalobrama amblycephala]
MATKRCLESDDSEQSPAVRFRCDNDSHHQQSTTETMRYLIQTVENMDRPKSSTQVLLDLLNTVQSVVVNQEEETDFDVDQFFNPPLTNNASNDSSNTNFDVDQFFNSPLTNNVSNDLANTDFDLANTDFDVDQFFNSPLTNDLSNDLANTDFNVDPFLNSPQIGEGSSPPQYHAFDPAAPNMGLTQGEIDSLVRDGGIVHEYTVIPRARFNGLEIHRLINLRQISSTDLAVYSTFLHDLLAEIVSFSRLLAGDGGVINITLRGSSLTSDVDALLSPQNNYDPDLFINQLEKILQSNSDVTVDEALDLRVSIAMCKNGGARRKMRDLLHNQVISKNRMNLFCPTNITNNLCFTICLAHFLNPEKPHTELEAVAASIQKSAGFTDQHKISFNDISCFERMLNIKIVTFHRPNARMLEKYTTTDDPHPKTVFLYLHDSHYYLIKNLKAFLGVPYVCVFCYQGYTCRRDHKCKFVCDVCNYPDCHTHPKKIKHCGDCLRYCTSDYCFEMHKHPAPGEEYAQCTVTKFCPRCNRRYHVSGANPKPHKCAAEHCVQCGESLVTDGEHQCFIQPIKPEKPNDRYIFYDFETRHENNTHIANFVCAVTFNGEEFVAEGPDCVERLIKKFRQPFYSNFTWIAHNASGFDNFILLEYFTRMGITPKIIMQGCRLILMYDNAFKQRFIDSYAFIPMRLAKTPAAFNLTNSEKGYFPHLFNRAENDDYIGPYPEKHFYGYSTMSTQEMLKFDDWYNGLSDAVFDFKKELEMYCKSDVYLLREACMKYRNEFILCTDLDPFNYTTLAGCAMAVYKTHFLPKDTIALTHDKAYTNQNKTYSNVSIEWLEYLQKSHSNGIQHALNHGEVSFGKYYVDGFYDDGTVKKAFEFLGCFFHGCERCYNPNDLNPLSKVPYGVLRRQVDDKFEILEHAYNLQIHFVWECDWVLSKQTDADVMDFMSTYTHTERLKPRDALFGGRTNAYKVYHKVSEGERVSYLDFTSLYPFVQARKSYPVGHPQIILKDFQNLEDYYGIIKATVVPPRNLLHPVLPFRCSGKLMFPLCRRCAEQQNQTTPCTHSDDERALTGTWVSIELLKAVEKGYVVVKLHEVWHFSQSSETLFCDYVKTFLQLKQESSGFPKNVVTEMDKESYVREYFEKEGIRLNQDKIEVNLARRSINKLLLNSLWGRFCLRQNLPHSELISEPEQFAQHIFGRGYDIKYFTFLSDSVALVQWAYAEGKGGQSCDVNVFIGAFTTAHARLELYDVMDKLGDRLLYTDMDSLLFTSKDGDWEPPLGPFLGDLTNELDYDVTL